jgi:hypothetical protein
MLIFLAGDPPIMYGILFRAVRKAICENLNKKFQADIFK